MRGKVVWVDDNSTKTISGIIINEDDNFIEIKAKDGISLMIAKRHLISVKKFNENNDDCNSMRDNYE
jgi:hypothetical protein